MGSWGCLTLRPLGKFFRRGSIDDFGFWIKVAADGLSCDRAEPEHGLRVIHHKPGMHLDGDLDAVVRGEFGVANPIRRNHLVPLPVENFAVVRRPRAGDPVGSASMR